MISNSKIYVGSVIHRRFKPKNHYFKYKVFSLLIDLNELEDIQNVFYNFEISDEDIIKFQA